jgi:hypothetical protein
MRIFWVLALAATGCGLSPGLKAALKQPDGYTFAKPAPAEQLHRVSDEGPIKWLIEAPVVIAADPVISTTEATSLGIEDPAVVIARNLTAELKTRGYPDAPVLAKAMRFMEDPPVVPANIAAQCQTPYLLHLQVAVETAGNDPKAVTATLVVFDRGGTMQFRTRCTASRADNAAVAPPKEQWLALEQQCATELLKEF